jgi:hypothetical protein
MRGNNVQPVKAVAVDNDAGEKVVFIYEYRANGSISGFGHPLTREQARSLYVDLGTALGQFPEPAPTPKDVAHRAQWRPTAAPDPYYPVSELPE